jgi:hypothetical protein
MCNWVLDFLTGRPHVAKVGNNISTLLILKSGRGLQEKAEVAHPYPH